MVLPDKTDILLFLPFKQTSAEGNSEFLSVCQTDLS